MVEMAVCGMQSVDLTRDAIKISSIYFSYNIHLMNQKNYCNAITSIHGMKDENTITSIQNYGG